jgi:hypothetical protein
LNDVEFKKLAQLYPGLPLLDKQITVMPIGYGLLKIADLGQKMNCKTVQTQELADPFSDSIANSILKHPSISIQKRNRTICLTFRKLTNKNFRMSFPKL